MDSLLFDAILPLLALALLDSAFKAEIRSVEDFYRVKVRAPRHSLDFYWKEDIKDTPIFRQAVVASDGTIRTSPTEALRYHTYLYYLQRLGLTTGFMQILNPYCIRRGSGEAVEGEHTRHRGTYGMLTGLSRCNTGAASASDVPQRCGDLPSLHQPARAV